MNAKTAAVLALPLAMVVVFATLVFPVMAKPQTARTTSDPAGQLAGLCEHSAASIGDLKSANVNDGLCEGTIDGWRNVIDELPVLTPDRRSQIHIDASATNGQLIRVFVAYVKAHPEVENKNALLVFTRALRNTGLLTEMGQSAK